MLRTRHVTIIGSVLVMVFVGSLQFQRPVQSALGNFLVVRDKITEADIIHVIAGPDEQTDYAIRLYQQGFGKKIFLTGGWCRWHNFYHGQHGRERALKAGIPLEAIATDDSPVTSTYTEVVRLREFMTGSQTPIRSVIVVSDPYHMRRARWTYRLVLGDSVKLLMAPVPFELSPYRHEWWTDKESRKMVRHEYSKILYYYLRYRLSWGPLKDWLASLDRD